MVRLLKNRWFKRIALLMLLFLAIGFWFSLPEPLFDDPTSTVIEDRNGHLLGAKIADDGQWRFPYDENVPEKFQRSITSFEDRYFFKHPGINIVSIFRAAWLNIKSGKIVSGGSTLSMQVIRLSRKGKPRTIPEKFVEMIMALRLELRYSKNEILALYASNAPFGGNVVGLDAATWRYYGKPPSDLTWAESATLAVLPNAPSLIYPGKNQKQLLDKRNRLLKKLLDCKVFDSTDFELALMEPLPGNPLKLDQSAPHLLTQIYSQEKGERITTTLDKGLQKDVSAIVERHHCHLIHNEIYNAAALVVEVESGNVLAYVGNTTSTEHEHGCDVDIVGAHRSSGSILKPILFAAMLNDGLILPSTLIPDIPTQIGGFNPMNFNRTYSGAVPAQKALYRSLNVPAVKMLKEYGVPRFRELLTQAGMTTLNHPSDHYGLSLILGGAETTMYDLATMYSSFSRVLNHFYTYNGKYDLNDYRVPSYKLSDNLQDEVPVLQPSSLLLASSIWFAFEAMRKVNLPDDLTGRSSFTSSEKIAWKTGTSFGFRDAWTVGTTPNHVVVVWVGNADGEGRPGLTGVSCAAPIMFDIFNLLPKSDWFDPPFDEMAKTSVCRNSGYRAGLYCDQVDTVYIPSSGLKTNSCPFHQLVHLDKKKQFRVTDECFDPAEMVHQSWFSLPPVMGWYYKKIDPLYKPLPPYQSNCLGYQNIPMEFVYPTDSKKLYIPINLNGEIESIVLELAHTNENAIVYWYLDEQFLGQTSYLNQMEICPGTGNHTIAVVDEFGNQLVKEIEIVNRDLVSKLY